MSQPGLLGTDPIEQQEGPVAIRNVAGMHHELQDQSLRVDEEVALTTIETFGPVVAADPPFSVVLTD